MQKLAKITVILLIFTLLFTACGQASKSESAYGPLTEGEAMRDFTAELVNGDSFTLSDHKGKVILLNFWATWCGPCVGEMPAFTRLTEQYGEDLVLLAVNSGENKKVVTQFLLDNGYTFPVALDADYAVSSLYPSDGIPYTVIFGTDGSVAHIQVGAGDAETMYAYYSQLIDELLK